MRTEEKGGEKMRKDRDREMRRENEEGRDRAKPS